MMTRNDRLRHNVARLGTLLGFALIGWVGCGDAGGARNAKLVFNDEPPAPLSDTTTRNGAPGPQLQPLQALIGTWNAKTSAWSHLHAAAETGKGTISNFWMLEGRFVGQEYKSRSQRPQYHGLGALGYDAARRVHTSVWLDTTSTSIRTATGSFNPSADVLTLEGICPDPTTGNLVQCRSIIRIMDGNHYTFELYRESADGKMFKAMDVTYTR